MRTTALALTLFASSVLAAESPVRTLAVSYFDVNATDPELQVLKKGMADMVMSDMANVQGLRVVEREKLNEIMAELKLAKSPFIDQAQAVKLGKGLSATHLLTGAITVLDKQMRLEARVVDVQSGEALGSRKVEGTRDDFFSLEKELVDLLIEALTIKPTIKEKAALRKSQTESFPAFASYSMGLDRTDRKDDAGARQAFEEARKADPNYEAVKAAMARLSSAVKAIEDRRAQSIDEQLAALTPDDPDLFRKIEKIDAVQGGPDDREAAHLAVVEFLVGSALRPAKSRYAGLMIGESTLEFWEFRKLGDIAGTFGTANETSRSTPLIFEYLVRKYPDDPTTISHLGDDVQRLERMYEKTDFSKPPPDYEGRGDYTDRHRRYRDFLERVAKKVPLPKGLSRDPRESLKRLKDLLVKEHERRVKLLDTEFARRVKALDPKDMKKLTEEVSNLDVIGQNSHEITHDRAEAVRKQLMVCDWLLQHPDVRPYHGGDKDPIWLEESMVMQWVTRYDDDPESWALIPPVGEYLLKKFPDAKYLTSQLKLHQKRIEESQQDMKMAQRKWADMQRDREYEAAPDVRAFFKRVAKANKR